MLADLERCQVEPERAELPAQLGDLAPGHPAEAVGGERLLDLDQLGVEVGRAAVASGPRRRLAGEGRARPAQSLGDEPEALAVRLVREAPPELAIGLGQVLGVAGEARRQRPGHPVLRHRGGDRLHEPRGHGLVAVQDVIGVDAQGLLGDLGGDPRVAVAVAADPAPPVQERPHPRRPRPAPTGVGRGPRRSAGDRVERLVEDPVEARRQREQRRVEERHAGAHFVERRRGHEAQVRGPPQQR